MIKSELLPVRDRILKALEELPENRLRRGKYPKAPGVHNTAIKRLMENESLPGAENLIRISEATGRSIDYFLTGEGKPKFSLRESTPDPYDSRSLEALETVLLFEVLEKVEEVNINQRQKLSVRQTARLASLVYDHCNRNREKPSVHLVEEYLLLTD